MAIFIPFAWHPKRGFCAFEPREDFKPETNRIFEVMLFTASWTRLARPTMCDFVCVVEVENLDLEPCL